MMLQQRSQLALSKVWMCDAPEAEEAPAEDGAVSVLDDLSAENAAMLEQIKGLTLSEAAEVNLITWHVELSIKSNAESIHLANRLVKSSASC